MAGSKEPFEELLWTEWRPFPNPREGGFLMAPLAIGVYQFRIGEEIIHTNWGMNVAYDISSMFRGPWMPTERADSQLQYFIYHHIEEVEYRCIAGLDSVRAVDLVAYIIETEPQRFE